MVSGWADSGQERGAALTFTLVKLSRVSQGLRLRLSGVYSVSHSLTASTEAPWFWFSFFPESQYRMPWLLEDGLSPFQRARGMAYSFAGPSRGVHRGSGEGACDKTRPHYLCDSLSSTGRLAKSEDTTYFRKTGDRGTCRGCGEKNWKSRMHSAAEKSGRLGVCVCHTITTARYGNRSHLDSQRKSGLEEVCDMLIVGGMSSSAGEAHVSRSVCLRQSSSAPRHSTFAQSLAASACSLSPVRRVLHAARILHTRYLRCRRADLEGSRSHFASTIVVCGRRIR
jgi:hypothetical protein